MADTKEATSYLEMSDEEIANLDPNTIGQALTVEEDPAKVEGDAQNTDTAGSATDGANGDGEDLGEGATAVADPQGQAEAGATEQSKQSEEGASAAASQGKEESTQKDGAAEAASKEQTIDYEAAYKKLTAPFKANGREIQVTSVEDAVSLMQMGANYNKKMAALKPNLKLMKLLENNGLLNEEKLSYLIDLEKKNPEAISKLVKDSGVDPLDISAEKAGGYKPGNHAVNDTEVELDQVLDEIKDSSKYVETLDVVTRELQHGDGEHAALELEHGGLVWRLGLAHGLRRGALLRKSAQTYNENAG